MLASRGLTRRRLLSSATASLPALALGYPPLPANADTDRMAALLACLCDIVIPDSDTPGANAAGVPAFLALALPHQLFGGDATTLPALLEHLDARAGGGGGFLAARRARQTAIVTTLDRATYSHQPPPPVPLPTHGSTKPQLSISAPVDNDSQRLWRIVKSAIVTGFYTSESGGSHSLAYDLVPGRYDADIALNTRRYLSNLWIENAF